jgi:glucose-6-phosphate isomerase
MTPEAAWSAVEAEAARLRPVHLRELVDDPARAAALSFRLGDLTLDLAREKLDARALAALLELARAAGLEARRDALFAGEPVNATEGRAALHMALRGGAEPPPGDDVEGTLARVLAFAEAVRGGRLGPVTDVVNIGIGGSDLGPAMAARALAPDIDGPRLHFVSNVDGAHLADALRGLDAARTLVVVCSKSFTTLETMANARAARAWLSATLGAEGAGARMAAVSTNVAAARAFGIAPERVFGFWDWVGGRYSVWSAVGLALAMGIGGAGFRGFLSGAAEIDRHFRETPLEANLPVLLGLLGVWRRNALGLPTLAIVPYEQRLERFPAFVQQLAMESNGKRVTAGGAPVARATCPVVWGEPGTNAQHSFFQLLHQGTDVVPVEFIAAAEPREEMSGHHAALLANCLAQGRALALGRTEAQARAEMASAGLDAAEIDRLAPHRTFPGDRPSTTILHRRLDPAGLGRLVALYEHRVFVEGAVWGVNSFDQWGVELGKEMAKALAPAFAGDEVAGLDAATAGLLARLRETGA